MKAIITITDNPNGTANMAVKFDPPLKREDLPKTNVGRSVLAFVEFMKGKAKAVECTSVTTTKEGD